MLYEQPLGDNCGDLDAKTEDYDEDSSDDGLVSDNTATVFCSNFKFEHLGSERQEASTANDCLDGLRTYLKKNGERTEKMCGAPSVEVDISGNEFVNLNMAKDLSTDLLNEFCHIKDKIIKKKRKKSATSVCSGQKDFFDKESDKFTRSFATSTRTFSDLNISRPILKAVSEAGYKHPTPIQLASIPLVLAGRDICACSKTGTGKTAAFMIPILDRLLYKPEEQKPLIRVLILVPTRELAIQVFQVSRVLAKHSNIRFCLLAGGLDTKVQEATLINGPDIVIGTLGRLLDHLNKTPGFTLNEIEILVLDEADRLLQDAFADQLDKLISLCAKNRQTLLFSATMTDQVEDLVRVSMDKPVKLFLDENPDVPINLRQEFIRIRKDRLNEREAIVAALITRNFPERTIVFVRTKTGCERMEGLLKHFGVKAGQLHGGLSQTLRIKMLAAFKLQDNLNVLCATDLAARGLDIEQVKTVINMQMPADMKSYVHRVGRTARAGNSGTAISLLGENDRTLLKQILKLCRSQEAVKVQIIQRTIPPEVVNAYIQRIHAMDGSGSLMQSKSERFADQKIESKTKTGTNIKKKAKKETINLANKSPSFTSQLTDISPKALKRLRYGPDDLEFKKAKQAMVQEGILRKGPKKAKR